MIRLTKSQAQASWPDYAWVDRLIFGPDKRPRKPRAKRGAKAVKVAPSVFQAACVAHGLPEPVPEYTFHPSRRWRFDFAWVAFRVALEVDGGAYIQGRHTRGKGFVGDQEKRNQAIVRGWKVLHCVPADVKSGKVFELLKQVLPVKPLIRPHPGYGHNAEKP